MKKSAAQIAQEVLNKTAGIREALKVFLTGRVPVYHGTSAFERAPSILREGLKPFARPGIHLRSLINQSHRPSTLLRGE
jgi:RNA:NAD 2'-phosphotransferase (TPT1/KptA family)